MEKKYMHEVVMTAIIHRKGKYLIVKRSANKRRLPGYWSVPGGRLEIGDYFSLPKDRKHYWRNVLETALRREVKEETGLLIKDISYITSLATIHPDGSPSIVISCAAEYAGGEVVLQKEEADDYQWVSIRELGKYKLLDGLKEEFLMSEKRRRGIRSEWQREQVTLFA